MRRLFTATLIVLMAVGGIVVPVQAAMISGTFSGDATVTPTGTPGVFSQTFTGDGTDAKLGSFSAQGQSTVDFSRPPNITISNGMLSETFSQGKLLGTSSGSGTGNGNGTATFTIDFVITGGTGAFNGATGDATLTGTITQTSATTESITGTYIGTVTPIPEPSTLLLLAFGAPGFATYCLRRRSLQRTHS